MTLCNDYDVNNMIRIFYHEDENSLHVLYFSILCLVLNWGKYSSGIQY